MPPMLILIDWTETRPAPCGRVGRAAVDTAPPTALHASQTDVSPGGGKGRETHGEHHRFLSEPPPRAVASAVISRAYISTEDYAPERWCRAIRNDLGGDVALARKRCRRRVARRMPATPGRNRRSFAKLRCPSWRPKLGNEPCREPEALHYSLLAIPINRLTMKIARVSSGTTSFFR